MEDPLIKKLLAIGSVTAALGSIIGLYFIFFPRAPGKAVKIDAILVQRLQDWSVPLGECESGVMVSFQVQTKGYANMPLHVYQKLDDSNAKLIDNGGIPCPPPIGAWNAWQLVKDLQPSFQDQSIQLQAPLTLPLRKTNRTLQLQVRDARNDVVAMAQSAPFDAR
jgi:hypothetical protein